MGISSFLAILLAIYNSVTFLCCCAGTLLVNERMLESYVIARDRFLIPNGKMFPTVGRYIEHFLYFSPFFFFCVILLSVVMTI